MVEYGVNVTNKFGFLSDDEMDGPEEMLRKAEALGKKDEKSASQKKADKNAASRKKKETAAAAALKAAAREAEAKKAQVTTVPARNGSRDNKENRPEGDRGRGRGRGLRGGPTNRGGRGGAAFDNTRLPIDQNTEVRDTIGDRFGEGRGGGRGRGRGRGEMRGRSNFRGGRGGFAKPFDGMSESNNFNPQQTLIGDNDTNHFGGERQNLNEFGDNHPRGGYRGGRGGDRPFRGGRRGGDGGGRGGDGGGRGGEGGGGRGSEGGGRGRQFDRFSGSERTGIKQVDKKDGYGRGNWGNEHDELMGATNNESPEKVTAENEKIEENVVPREKTEEELRIEAEEEALSKQLTLDEFKAQMADKILEPQFNIRRAGEGVNAKEYDRLVPMAKHTVEDAPEEEIVVVRREPRAKHLNIEINFTDEQRGGRNSRMREGGFRGGRGSRGGGGGGRDGRGSRTMQNIEFSNDSFPALGSQ